LDSVHDFLWGKDNTENGANAALRYDQAQKSKEIIKELAKKHTSVNQYFLPVLDVDINLQDLNKGAYGNSAFSVEPEKNPQWHCIYADPQRNQIKYFVDVHSMYSLLTTTNFEMVVNFDKKMTVEDEFSQALGNLFGWVGGIFDGIFGGAFDIFVKIALLIIVIVCFPLIISLVKKVFGLLVDIIKVPINLIAKLAKKAGGT
jgi:hypothetical protein